MSDLPPDKVLVIGDDTRSFLAIVRSLGRRGLTVHAAPFDAAAPALASRYVARVHRLPDCAVAPDAWCEALHALLRRERYALVVPCCDRSILCLDARRPLFREFAIALPTPRVIEALFDKARTRDLALRLAVPVTPGRLLEKADTVEMLVAEFGLPLVLKPRRSYSLAALGRRGHVSIARSVEEARLALGRIGDRREYLVERYFPGIGVGISVLAARGRILTAFQHRRMQEPRSGGGSSLRVSEALDPAMLAACRRIAADTALTGLAMFEFRADRDSGAWILVEVNARPWGSLPLPVALGVDFPFHLYELIVHGRETGPIAYAENVRGRNLLINAYDILVRSSDGSLPSLLRAGVAALDFALQPLRWLTGAEKSDTFVADDLRPALRELSALPAALLARRGEGRARPTGSAKAGAAT